MKLKLTRTLIAVMICIMGFSIPIFAQTEKVKAKGPIFMGKVLGVEEKDKFNNIRIRVKGYIKGCEVYEEEIFVIISNDTKVIANNCNEEKKSDEEKNKDSSTNLNIEVGDIVFICLSDVMTSSIPPQSSARKIQVTKIKS